MKKYVFFALSLAIVSCGEINSTETETAMDTTAVFVDTTFALMDSVDLMSDTATVDSENL
jgi:hypothetical protein